MVGRGRGLGPLGSGPVLAGFNRVVDFADHAGREDPVSVGERGGAPLGPCQKVWLPTVRAGVKPASFRSFWIFLVGCSAIMRIVYPTRQFLVKWIRQNIDAGRACENTPILAVRMGVLRRILGKVRCAGGASRNLGPHRPRTEHVTSSRTRVRYAYDATVAASHRRTVASDLLMSAAIA